MFRVKQIAIMTLGLILTIGALTTIYPHDAAGISQTNNAPTSAITNQQNTNTGGNAAAHIQQTNTNNGGNAAAFNGINGGSGQTPPGLGTACGTPAGNHNPNCGGSTPTGGTKAIFGFRPS